VFIPKRCSFMGEFNIHDFHGPKVSKGKYIKHVKWEIKSAFDGIFPQ